MPKLLINIHNQAEYIVDGQLQQNRIPDGPIDITISPDVNLSSVEGAIFNGKAFLLGCTSLTSVAGATFNNYAYLCGCKGLTSLERATFNDVVDLYSCTGLTSLERAIFNGDASLDGCTGLTSVAGATFNGSANLINCTGLTSVEDATFNGKANLYGCTGLASVAGATFNGEAVLSGCTGLTSLAGATFNGEANLVGCTGLTSVAGATFNGNTGLDGCTGLTSVAGVTFNGNTGLSGCTGLTSLEGATFNGDIDLRGCTGLLPTTELINQLEAMEAQGKTVTWPEHFGRGDLIDGAKARLGASIGVYTESNPEGAPATSYLFNKFLSEGLGERDGKAAVVASVSPFLELIEGEPKHLGWVEEIAKHYLQGCVNQPVAGFSEISAWVAIAQKTELSDKIEAARQLMALEEVKQYVTANSPGQGLEVEGGNALFREVHKQLVVSGMDPWPGVPGSISYEGSIRNWLTDNKIIDATERVAESNTKPLSEVVDYLLHIHPGIWSATAFPEKIAEITAKYASAKEELGELINNEDAIPDKYKPKNPDGTIDNRQLTADERMTLLSDAYKSIELGIGAEIAETVRELTVTVLQPVSQQAMPAISNGVLQNEEKSEEIIPASFVDRLYEERKEASSPQFGKK